MGRIIAISDVHGHYDELMALVKKVKLTDKDTLVMLGDYIDRGPKSKEVVEQIIKWKKEHPHWQFVYGNHEDLMLDALFYGGKIYHSYDLWYEQGGKETHQSYLPDDLTPYEKAISNPHNFIPTEHMAWLAALPRFYETDKYIFVHGGVKPGKTPQETSSQDLIWIRDEFIDSKYDWGKKVIFGHTARQTFPGSGKYEPIVMDNKIGIDTAVCYSALNKLTALVLPSEKFYDEKSHGRI